MPDWKRAIRARLQPLGLPAETEADLVEELSEYYETEWAQAARLYGDEEATRLLSLELAATDAREWLVRSESAPRQRASDLPTRSTSHWLADLRDDLRFGLRTIRRAPTFAAVAIATLGLGIGATTAVYGVIDAVLVRSLPFANADQLVRVKPAQAGGRQNLSVADFLAVRSRVSAFSSVATYGILENGLTFTTGDQPERAYGASVSGDFFATLGVPALIGRTFSRADELPGAPAELVLSYDFWKQKLGGSPDIVGRTLQVQGSPVIVVGIMPPGFWFPKGDLAEFWTNSRINTPSCECMFTRRVIARLAPGATPKAVQAQLDAAAGDVRASFHDGAKRWTFSATPMRQVMLTGITPVLLLLMAAVVFVLLIACVNVINLMLARASAREAELSVRVALGAGRARLARQLLAESAVLAVCGGLVAVVIARWGLSAIMALVPSSTPVLHDVSIGLNSHVLLAAGGCVILCTLLVGLVPAAVVARNGVHGAIRLSSRSTSRSRLRDALVVAEIALALMLVVGAGLMLRSLDKLRAVDTGVRSSGIMTASISLPNSRYRSSRQIIDFSDRLLAQLRAVPGVTSAAISDGLPPAGVGDQQNFLVEGTTLPPGGWEPIGDHLDVSDGYFATMGIPLRSGRLFDERDRDTSVAPAIISERLANRFFRGRSPLGHRLRLSGDHWVTVVGVVGNVAYEGLASEERLAVYEPFAQVPGWTFSVVARSSDPYGVVPPLRHIVASLDREVALAQVQTLDQLSEESSAANRFRAWLLGALAGLALLLATVGIYGLVSFVTQSRTKEMGIRIALGAQDRQILWAVMRGALGRATLGIILGAAGALALRHWLTALLFGITATDPVTFTAVALLLVAAAAAASWLPARRASHSDPILALRSE